VSGYNSRMADEKITLEFIARQMELLLDRMGTMEDQTTVLTGICMRLEGSFQGLIVEMRGMHRLVDRLERRIRKLEDSETT